MSKLLNESQVIEINRTIDSYQPNPDVLEQFRASSFAVIAGPTAAGKDTLRDALCADEGYVRVLSTTTRPRREDETEGKTYHFVSYDEIKKQLQAGHHFQVALVHKQQVSGMHINEIKKIGQNEMGLSILIVQVERQLHRLKPGIRTIFLIPPSFEELANRLKRERITESAEINRRLTAAKKEIKIALNTPRYQCIISDEQMNVRRVARMFLQTGKMNTHEDNRARKAMDSILEQL